MVIAFDLDETLGVPVTDGRSVVGFQLRPGCRELLADLRRRRELELVLWTVSSRRYEDKVLGFALAGVFGRTYTWDEWPRRWKDVRALGVDCLVDDSAYHRELAEPHGLAGRYVIVPAYGSPADDRDPLAWAGQVRAAVL